MQSKEDLEHHYRNPDPWGYQAHPADAERKQKILAVTLRAARAMYPRLAAMLEHATVHATDPRELGHIFVRALDIGAGEGWITKDLPADEIQALELSDAAASRFPPEVTRVLEPSGRYDLIVASGVMYHQYDHVRFIDLIKQHSSGMVVLCNIADWEVSKLKELGEPVWVEEFPYREYVERIRVYEKPAERGERVCWYCADVMKKIHEDPDDEGQAGGDPDQHFTACPVRKLGIQWQNR